jgi:hypothetical protein
MTSSPSSATTQSSTVPLALWPIGQADESGEPSRSSIGSPRLDAVPAVLVRRILEEFSAPGSLVLDPLCDSAGILTVVAVCERRTSGIVPDGARATRIQDEANRNLSNRHRSRISIRVGGGRGLRDVLSDMVGRVDLVCSTSVERHRSGERAHRRTDLFADAMAILRPGGFLAVVTQPRRGRRGFVDRAGSTVGMARSAGFIYFQHVVAVDAAISDGCLVARPTPSQRRAVREAHRRGLPLHLRVHWDVSVFQKPIEKGATRGR